jgi:hypothetical protein
MTPHPDNRDAQLERFIHQTLRGQPPRRAPRSLEERVLAEIGRRAALPWWRKSFVHWPLAARAVFLVGCIGLVKLALMGSVWIMAGFDTAQFRDAFAQPVAWVDGSLAVAHAIAGCFEIVTRNIPPLWLYGGLAVVAAAYTAVFGLGAAAYRALQPHR